MNTITHPYASAAEQYRDAGWLGVLPLPAARKSRVPGGFTGRDGRWPTAEEIAAWVDSRADGNIALRLPADVIGLDVDNYDGKPGAETLADRESRWGSLPPTVRTTSRTDGDSGIRLYRVPTGLAWPNVLGEGVDIVRHAHRYAVVAPSLHPEGRVYRWVDADGADVEIPSPADLPALPAAWIEGLSLGDERDYAAADEVAAHFDGLPDGEPHPDVSAALSAYEAGLTNGDRHRAVLDVTNALAVAAALGYPGVPSALALAEARICAERGSTREGSREFNRALAGSVRAINNGDLVVSATSDTLAFVCEDLAINGAAPTEGTGAPQSGEPSSWVPVDLTGILDGSSKPVEPTLMPREDGAHLVYPGLTHSFHGESESGKSMLLQLETIRLVSLGRPVLYLDFESDAHSVVNRLLAFGARREDLLAHLTYVRPEEDPRKGQGNAGWRAILARKYDLAVVDGVTDSIAIFGYSTKDNDEVTLWVRAVPRLIAERTGAAVAVIDHVTKDSGGRGRFAIGGQAKMASLSGAGYVVEVEQALAPGRLGVISLRVAKDRPGRVRENGGAFRKSDRTQEVAKVVIDSRNKSAPPVVSWQAPEIAARDEDGTPVWKPTAVMEKISRTLEAAPERQLGSTSQVEKAVGGNKGTIAEAVALLVQAGHVRTAPGPRNATVYTLVRPYRQSTDMPGFDPDIGSADFLP